MSKFPFLLFISVVILISGMGVAYAQRPISPNPLPSNPICVCQYEDFKECKGVSREQCLNTVSESTGLSECSYFNGSCQSAKKVNCIKWINNSLEARACSKENRFIIPRFMRIADIPELQNTSRPYSVMQYASFGHGREPVDVRRTINACLRVADNVVVHDSGCSVAQDRDSFQRTLEFLQGTLKPAQKVVWNTHQAVAAAPMSGDLSFYNLGINMRLQGGIPSLRESTITASAISDRYIDCALLGGGPIFNNECALPAEVARCTNGDAEKRVESRVCCPAKIDRTSSLLSRHSQGLWMPGNSLAACPRVQSEIIFKKTCSGDWTASQRCIEEADDACAEQDGWLSQAPFLSPFTAYAPPNPRAVFVDPHIPFPPLAIQSPVRLIPSQSINVTCTGFTFPDNE